MAQDRLSHEVAQVFSYMTHEPNTVSTAVDSIANFLMYTYMSLVMRKPVYGVCDQVGLKPACSADETNFSN